MFSKVPCIDAVPYNPNNLGLDAITVGRFVNPG